MAVGYIGVKLAGNRPDRRRLWHRVGGVPGGRAQRAAQHAGESAPDTDWVALVQTYWLRLYPQQPLKLDDPTVIPARALRGAFIAILKRDCVPGAHHDAGPCNPACTFWPIFGTNTPGGSIRLGNAYATRQDAIGPFPGSARTCRVVPGFRDQGGHGVTDVAIRGWIFERAVTADPKQLLIPFETRCVSCGAELIPCAGRLVRSGEHEWYTADVTTTSVRTTHRPSRTANSKSFVQSGIILNMRSGSGYYVACIDLHESVEVLVRETLSGGLVIGGSRTRGMGAMRTELIPRPDPTLTTHMRIVAFNQALRAEQRFYAIMASNALGTAGQPYDDGAWYFTLDVTDMQMSIGWQPNPLAEVNALRGVQTMRRWVNVSMQDGRNTATGKRSGTQQLLSGTFLCRAAPDGDRAALEQTLAYLETHGIGFGSERGYGNVTVCDPFHLESDPL